MDHVLAVSNSNDYLGYLRPFIVEHGGYVACTRMLTPEDIADLLAAAANAACEASRHPWG